MKSLIALENSAQLGRVTCGWKLPHLELDPVLRYWRDVHSPSIARRDGIWEYRHFQFEAVDANALGVVPGVVTECPSDQQLMWVSDVRYADDLSVDAFGQDPAPEVRASMLADIDLIVDQSTTYRCVGANGVTLADTTRLIPPQGAPAVPAFSLFFRRRSDEASFRIWLGAVAKRWASHAHVRRLRISLFETPDMEAERASGYPIKTHPPERQYQAWIDISVDSAEVLKALFAAERETATHLRTVHAYPVKAIYTSNHGGRPTFVGLRGYPAYEALTGISGYNQADPALLEWMYGDVAQGVTLEPIAS